MLADFYTTGAHFASCNEVWARRGFTTPQSPGGNFTGIMNDILKEKTKCHGCSTVTYPAEPFSSPKYRNLQTEGVKQFSILNFKNPSCLL